MRCAFLGIGIKQAFVGMAVDHGRQLPGQVAGVAHTAVHALPGKGRGQVGGVTRDQGPIYPPLLGNAGVKGVDHFAQDGQVHITGFALRNHGPDLAVGQHRFGRFARLEHELIAHRALRAGQPDGWPLRVAVGAGVAKGGGSADQIGNQPALLIGAALPFDAQLLAHRAAPAIATDQPAATQGLHLILVTHLHLHAVICLGELHQLVFKTNLHVRVSGQAIAQQSHQLLLAKGIAFGVAVFGGGGLDFGKQAVAPRVVMHPVALHDHRQKPIQHAHGLQGAQAFVVNRHGPRFIHRVAGFFNQPGAHAGLGQQMRQHQARGAGAHDGYITIEGGHVSMTCGRLALVGCCVLAGMRPHAPRSRLTTPHARFCVGCR